MIVLAIALLGILFVKFQTGQKESSGLDTSLVGSLFQKVNSKADITHLADGLNPPTNKWFSGIVFGQPQSVFPLPLSFKPSDKGYSLSAPTVTSTPNAIFGSYNPDLTATIKDASGYVVSRYDELSATLTYSNADQPIGRLTIASGSPYVFFRAAKATQLELKGYSSIEKIPEGYELKKDAKTYVLSTSLTDVKLNSDQTATLTLEPDALVTLAVVANESDREKVLQYAQNELTSVDTRYAVENRAKTTFSYHTQNNQPTLFASLPHQNINQPKALSASFDSIYGPMPVYSGKEFSFELELQKASSTLNLSTLSANQKAVLKTLIKQDIEKADFSPADTYFAGKALYRAANLYQLAMQLDLDTEAATIKQKLTNELALWFDPTGFEKRSNKYFYYDSSLKGIVGETPAFGSELFNDHHFHYGYFIYAAAVLAEHDPGLARKYAPMVSLLAGDIASPRSTKEFIQRRSFDPYAGHSWASGNGQFADGNNQESSSEAINAWNALALWGQASKNRTLQQQSQWMLSNEVATANAYWLSPDLSNQTFNGYQHPFVSLNWGGKRDYATFFSSDPKAVLGIQLIPMNPVMTYLAKDKASIERNIHTVRTGGQAQFSDYLLMYESLLGRDVSSQATGLDAKLIDGANSRSYMLAWLYSHQH